jgi:Uma2 family endonuclease
VQTSDGVKVGDVAFLSPTRFTIIADEFASSICPEIIVEVMLMHNSPAEMMVKKELYFAAGSQEFWLCSEKGEMTFFRATGELPNSELCPQFPKNIAS